MAAYRQLLIVRVIKEANFAGLRGVIVCMMQGNVAKGSTAGFLEAIYFALNQTTKVMHAFGTIAVFDI